MALRCAVPVSTEGGRVASGDLFGSYVKKLRGLCLQLEEATHHAKKNVTYKRWTKPWCEEDYDDLVEDGAHVWVPKSCL